LFWAIGIGPAEPHAIPLAWKLMPKKSESPKSNFMICLEVSNFSPVLSGQNPPDKSGKSTTFSHQVADPSSAFAEQLITSGP